MYQVVDLDPEFPIGGGTQVPAVTLGDEYGGRAQIAVDDTCWVLYLLDNTTGKYKKTAHIFPEAHEAMKSLPHPGVWARERFGF